MAEYDGHGRLRDALVDCGVGGAMDSKSVFTVAFTGSGAAGGNGGAGRPRSARRLAQQNRIRHHIRIRISFSSTIQMSGTIQRAVRDRHTCIYQFIPSVESFLSDPEPLDHGFVSAMYTEEDLAH